MIKKSNDNFEVLIMNRLGLFLYAIKRVHNLKLLEQPEQPEKTGQKWWQFWQ